MSPQHTVADARCVTLVGRDDPLVDDVAVLDVAVLDVAVFGRLPIVEAGCLDRALPTRSQPVGDTRRPAYRGHRVRLTRRGRLTFVLAVAVLIALAVVVGVCTRAAWAGDSGAPGAQGAAVATQQGRTVVVQPGDTLWSIASRFAPGADPRVTVQRIVDLNKLRSVGVEAGQQLVLPAA